MKKTSVLLILALLLALVTVSPVLAHERIARVAGEITALDAEAGTITVQPRDGDPVTVQTNETRFLRKVHRSGLEPITFDDLAVEDRVQVEGVWDGDTFDARKVIVMTPPPPPASAVVNGTISGSPDAGAFTVQPREGDPVSVQTGDDTQFFRQLRRRLEPITFDELADGDRVRVEGAWDGDVLNASRVIVMSPPPSPPPAIVNGTISGSPDASAGTFTVQPREGDPVSVQTGDDTQFFRQVLRGRPEPITFDDLADGDRVRVEGTREDDVLNAQRVTVLPARPESSDTG